MQSSSIHFLRTKLCKAFVDGFETIDLETLHTQSFLDSSDELLDFVRRRSDNTHPTVTSTVSRTSFFCLAKVHRFP